MKVFSNPGILRTVNRAILPSSTKYLPNNGKCCITALPYEYSIYGLIPGAENTVVHPRQYPASRTNIKDLIPQMAGSGLIFYWSVQ